MSSVLDSCCPWLIAGEVNVRSKGQLGLNSFGRGVTESLLPMQTTKMTRVNYGRDLRWRLVTWTNTSARCNQPGCVGGRLMAF